MDTSDRITIGRNVRIGMRTLILTGSHELGPAIRRADISARLPVTIGDGVWIGAGATILPGVSVGSGCVIGAGAVVCVDCEPDTVYSGVPAVARREMKD